MNIPPKGYNIFLRCWKVKGSVFCQQNDLKILLKKNKTEIIGEFFRHPYIAFQIPMATRPDLDPTCQHFDWITSLLSNYVLFWCKITPKEPLDYHMWIHEYISWHWQELKRIKANRRAIPRIFRNAWHLRNHAVESKGIAYLQIHRLHSSFRSIWLSLSLDKPTFFK